MHRQERELTECCHICGEEIDPQDPGNFALSPSATICAACARRRGGQFDSETEEWRTPPSVVGGVPPAARE